MERTPMTTNSKLLTDIKRAGIDYDHARTRRDALIIQARRAGLPVRAIAEFAGISHMTVLNIVKRQEKHP